MLFDELKEWHIDDLCASPTVYGRTTRARVRHPELWRQLLSQETNDTKLIASTLAAKQTIWLWSDLHFGHKNILTYADRPFRDTDDMREKLIQNYNSLVQPDDLCIWVGDVAFLEDSEANKILHRCIGKKMLIIGNHDLHKGKVKKLHFDEIHAMLAFEYNNIEFVLTHYPSLNLDDTIYPGFFNIHGHEHIGGNEFTRSPHHFNVNCEFHDYKPITLDSIVAYASTDAV